MRFLFRLALALGKTVGQLLHDLDAYGGRSLELTRWMAYARVEPFGYGMDNFRMGVLAATTANVAPRGKNAKALKPSDFYPRADAGGTDARQERALAARRIKRGKR
jgi:hypothetical protein